MSSLGMGQGRNYMAFTVHKMTQTAYKRDAGWIKPQYDNVCYNEAVWQRRDYKEKPKRRRKEKA